MALVCRRRSSERALLTDPLRDTPEDLIPQLSVWSPWVSPFSVVDCHVSLPFVRVPSVIIQDLRVPAQARDGDGGSIPPDGHTEPRIERSRSSPRRARARLLGLRVPSCHVGTKSVAILH